MEELNDLNSELKRHIDEITRDCTYFLETNEINLTFLEEKVTYIEKQIQLINESTTKDLRKKEKECEQDFHKQKNEYQQHLEEVHEVLLKRRNLKDLHTEIDECKRVLTKANDSKDKIFKFCCWVMQHTKVPKVFQNVDSIKKFLELMKLMSSNNIKEDDVLLQVVEFNKLFEKETGLDAINTLSIVEEKRVIKTPEGNISINEGSYNGRSACIKIFPIEMKDVAEKEETIALDIHHELPSLNVVQFIGKEYHDMGLCLMMDYLEGDLKSYIDEELEMKTSDQIREVIQQTIRGFHDIHCRGFHHTMMALENVLYKVYDGKINIRVAYLHHCDKTSGQCLCDLSGLGKVLFCLATQNSSHSDEIDLKDVEEIGKTVIQIGYEFPNIARDLILKLIGPLSSRPTWEQIMDHPIMWGDQKILSYIHYSKESNNLNYLKLRDADKPELSEAMQKKIEKNKKKREEAKIRRQTEAKKNKQTEASEVKASEVLFEQTEEMKDKIEKWETDLGYDLNTLFTTLTNDRNEIAHELHKQGRKELFKKLSPFINGLIVVIEIMKELNVHDIILAAL